MIAEKEVYKIFDIHQQFLTHCAKSHLLPQKYKPVCHTSQQ